MTAPHRALAPMLFPGLLHLRMKPMPPVEPPWFSDGWIELTNPDHPHWRALCETDWDIRCELARGVRGATYRAAWWQRFGDGYQVLMHMRVIMCPTSGELSFEPFSESEEPRTRGSHSARRGL
jgi:hypothetical protein